MYEVRRRARQVPQLHGSAAERNYLYFNKNSAADSSGFLKDMLETCSPNLGNVLYYWRRSVFNLSAEIFQRRFIKPVLNTVFTVSSFKRTLLGCKIT